MCKSIVRVYIGNISFVCQKKISIWPNWDRRMVSGKMLDMTGMWVMVEDDLVLRTCDWLLTDVCHINISHIILYSSQKSFASCYFDYAVRDMGGLI